MDMSSRLCFRLSLCTLLLALAFVGVSGCILSQARPSGMPQGDQYAFLDHHTYYSGTLVEGKCPLVPINFSTYHFDTGTGTLEGIVPFEVNDSLTLIYGESTSLSGDYGNGSLGMISGGYSLPYTSGNMTVNGFTSDGTLYITYRNQTIALESGKQLTDITTGTDRTDACTINWTAADTITYYGNYQKSSIKKAAVYE
jgi:hypothetical protein